MDLIWPFIAMFGVLGLLATTPVIREGVKRARIGVAVLRSELTVQRARRLYGRVKR